MGNQSSAHKEKDESTQMLITNTNSTNESIAISTKKPVKAVRNTRPTTWETHQTHYWNWEFCVWRQILKIPINDSSCRRILDFYKALMTNTCECEHYYDLQQEVNAHFLGRNCRDMTLLLKMQNNIGYCIMHMKPKSCWMSGKHTTLVCSPYVFDNTLLSGIFNVSDSLWYNPSINEHLFRNHSWKFECKCGTLLDKFSENFAGMCPACSPFAPVVAYNHRQLRKNIHPVGYAKKTQ